MPLLRLVIGDRNLSSWSLRPWLLIRRLGIDFETVTVRLDRADTAAAIARHSPAGRVPVLHDGDITVWDSLAIVEYLAERFPDAGIWPADRPRRAHARSVAAEMHAGFADLRRELPMRFAERVDGVTPGAAAAADIDRIVALWHEARRAHGQDGPFLFGAFSAADAMYAPVVSRFVTYGTVLPDGAARYREAIRALPEMREWGEAARRELWTTPESAARERGPVPGVEPAGRVGGRSDEGERVWSSASSPSCTASSSCWSASRASSPGW